MAKEATKIFNMIFNDMDSLKKEINKQILKILSLEGNDKFLEFVQLGIEQCSFNRLENDFLT